MTPPQPLTAGSLVVDRDSEDGDLLRVVAVYEDQPADAWRIDDLDATVAECNPEYPADDHVVAAVYRSEVVEEFGAGVSADAVRRAAARDALRVYTFPRGRLRRARVTELGGETA